MKQLNKPVIHEIYEIIEIIEKKGLIHFIHSINSKSKEFDLIQLLEKNGIDFKLKTLEDVLELIKLSLVLTCSGTVFIDSKKKRITLESKINSGHSLPWANLLECYLQKNGYKTKIFYQSKTGTGEKVHIRLNKK